MTSEQMDARRGSGRPLQLRRDPRHARSEPAARRRAPGGSARAVARARCAAPRDAQHRHAHRHDLLPGAGLLFSSPMPTSIPVAKQIQAHFDDLDYLYDLGEIQIKMSGCMNACGHHHVGHIGILGVDKHGEEWYQITIGGSATRGCRARRSHRPVGAAGRGRRHDPEDHRCLRRAAAWKRSASSTRCAASASSHSRERVYGERAQHHSAA